MIVIRQCLWFPTFIYDLMISYVKVLPVAQNNKSGRTLSYSETTLAEFFAQKIFNTN